MMAELPQRPSLERHVLALPEEASRVLRRYFARLRQRGFLEPGFNAAVAAAVLRGALFRDAMVRDVVPATFPTAAERAPRAYVRFVLRGALREAPKTARGRARGAAGARTARRRPRSASR